MSRPLGNRPPAIDQVLLFHDPDHPGRLRLHRLVDVTDHGQLVTRGDANLANDSTPVDLAAVQGVAVLRVPFVGLPIVWMREGRRVWLGAASLALLLLAAGSRVAPRTDTIPGPHTIPERPAIPEPHATPRQHRGWRRFARSCALALALSVLVIGVGTAIAVPAAAGFATTTSNPQSSWAGAAFWKCRSAVLADNPFLYYPLDESNGTTAVDASGNGRDGTFQGTVTKRVSGACIRDTGTAVTLNGTTGYISTPSQVAGSNTFSLQTWFKTTTTQGGWLIGFGTSQTGLSTSGDRQLYLANDGRLIFGVKPNTVSKTIATTGSFNDGAWHQVTASLSGAGMELYVDGSLAASNTTVTSGQATNGYWRIGYDNLAGWASAPTSRFFAGTLDNVAVYPSALSASTVLADYSAGR